ncbi:DUF4019 domain-containing protein [Dyella acidisoli]|uniref:DUF4019 domain-containing protein n=1 Tax=Dyella acidisoli TaxID=1867834 RepID=A0ABQ5XJE4_9GAMM|nr:DUF4019 domain-containing protein [Dyella acidisoli]GLQ91805.1 hypothetical protein GCM10007901_07550 [Dyella acidisoli]
MTHTARNRSSFTKRALQGCALSAALLGASAALAQQAPSGLEKAVATAAKWATQADAGQADAMWKASSDTMQKSVSQADWTKYIAQVRKEAGAEQSRAWLAVNKVDNPKGMPPGEYLNVVYNTKFANAATFETVSLTKSGSSWQPVGYIVRPQQPAKAPASGVAQPAASK